MDKETIKIALENYYGNLVEQGIMNKMPAIEIDEINEIFKVFKKAVYIDQEWLIYDKNYNVIFDNAGSFTALLSQGFINQANELIDNLKEIIMEV